MQLVDVYRMLERWIEKFTSAQSNVENVINI